MKLLAVPCRTTQDVWLMVKSSDKIRSAGGGNGNPLQYSCQKNSINSVKRQKDVRLEDEPHRSEGVEYAAGEETRAITNSCRKNEVAGPKQKQHSIVDVSGGKVKSDALKNNIAREPRKLGP